jgi:hypothetical protein
MKALLPVALCASVSALLVFAAAEADAQGRPLGTGQRIVMPPPPPIGSFDSFPGFIVVEREVVRIVEREAPPPVTPPLPPHQGEGKKESPRKPYVIGNSYASLPGGCMKMIEEGVSFYYCSGEWYRQMGGGRDARYRAVAKP